MKWLRGVDIIDAEKKSLDTLDIFVDKRADGLYIDMFHGNIKEDDKMDRNEYQNAFLQFIADLQETRVEITLCEHKLHGHEDYEKIRSLLFDVTHGMIYDLMEMIDGYSAFTHDKLDIINTKTGQRLKDEPFIELHDAVCDFIADE